MGELSLGRGLLDGDPVWRCDNTVRRALGSGLATHWGHVREALQSTEQQWSGRTEAGDGGG